MRGRRQRASVTADTDCTANEESGSKRGERMKACNLRFLHTYRSNTNLSLCACVCSIEVASEVDERGEMECLLAALEPKRYS